MTPDEIIARFWRTYGSLGLHHAWEEIMAWHRAAPREDQNAFFCSRAFVLWASHALIQEYVRQRERMRDAADPLPEEGLTFIQ